MRDDYSIDMWHCCAVDTFNISWEYLRSNGGVAAHTITINFPLFHISNETNVLHINNNEWLAKTKMATLFKESVQVAATHGLFLVVHLLCALSLLFSSPFIFYFYFSSNLKLLPTHG